MNPTYSISKPCSEDWNKMTAEEQGRHCQVCCKTVVDFSKKNNDEIVGFLKTNATNKICGRFRKEQLQPHKKISRPLNRYRTFFAALVFVFGGMLFSSCAGSRPGGNEVMGDVAYIPDSLHQQNDSLHSQNKMDTVKKSLLIDTTKKTGMNKNKNCKNPVVVPEVNEHLMGDVAYEPDTLK